MDIPKLSKEDAQELAWGGDVGEDGIGWTCETEETIDDHSRWCIFKSRVIRHTSSKRYFMLEWQVGATEYQDEGPFEYTDPEIYEVEKKAVTRTVWVKKETA